MIDLQTGDVRIDGPILQEQKEAEDELRVNWPRYERELAEIEEELRSDPNDAHLKRARKALHKIVTWLRTDAQKRATR